MLHNRIASDLRSHFSTVGPSPASALPSSSDAAGVVSPNPFGTLDHPAGPRLVVLPPQPPGTPAREPLLPDLIRVSAHRCAAFFAEAAVLVFVLGILDRYLAKDRLEFGWIAGAFLASLTLLAASILTDLSARRWLQSR